MTAPCVLDQALGTLPEPVITGTFSGAGRALAPTGCTSSMNRAVTASYLATTSRRSPARPRSSVALPATPTVVSRLLLPPLVKADSRTAGQCWGATCFVPSIGSRSFAFKRGLSMNLHDKSAATNVSGTPIIPSKTGSVTP